MLINHASKQVSAKIVYYGPGLCGKTTNLQYIFSVTNPKSRGELISMETEIERTLFFDLLPINVGLIKGYQTRFQLYTVPGQVFYDSTRKLVLKGADGVVFVADSQELMEQSNLDSFENLKVNLASYGCNIVDMPLVFQYNKRDLKNIATVEHLNRLLNKENRPCYEAVAKSGKGVIESLREISTLILVKIKEELEHSLRPTGKIKVNFDTDPGHQIIKKEELPYKKIVVERSEAETVGSVALEEEPLPAPPTPPPAEKREKEKAPAAEAKPAREEKKAAKDSRFDFLDKYEDTSRLTVIDKITPGDGLVKVDIRDGHDNSLKSLHIELHPDTKKITLILDVKR